MSDSFSAVGGAPVRTLSGVQILGTGSEDYFNDAWGLRPRTSHWFGSPRWQGDDAGDSGVYLRGLRKAQANLFCYPVGSGEVWEYRTDANVSEGVRRGVTPLRQADRPLGEWNQMTITVVGDRLTVDLNGHRVIDQAQLPGLPDRGPVGLQHEHGTLEFRNLHVRDMEADSEDGSAP